MTKENLHLTDPNQNSIGRLTIRPRDLLVVVFVVTLFIIFRQEHYSINVPDDMFFAYMEDPFNALGIATGVIGRYSASIGYIIFEKFSFNYHGTLVALNALGIVSFSIFSVAFCCLCAIDASTIAVVLASLMIALHPYNTENFDHDVNQLNTAIGYTALTFAIWAFAKRSGAIWMVIGTILLVVVASSYQPMTYYFLVFVTAISLLKLENAKQIWTNFIRGYSMLAVALAAYMTLHKVALPLALDDLAGSDEPMLQFTYANNARSEFVDLGDIPGKLLSYLMYDLRSLILPEPILPFSMKALFALLFVIPVILWLLGGPNTSEMRPRRSWSRFVLILLLLLMCASPLHILLRDPLLPPRTLMHVPTVFAALFLFAWVKS